MNDSRSPAAVADGPAPVPPQGGFPVVLTADRTLLADYPILFDGMVAGSQTTRTPGLLMRWLVAPRARSENCRAVRAPLGLRRVEAALTAGGWGRGSVAVVPPERVADAVGPATKIVGVSCGDPLGLGMNSSTMTAITGGRIYASRWFQALIGRIRRLRRRLPGLRIVVGGPGAWQLAGDDEARRRLGVDHVVLGYCEGNVAGIFSAIAEDGRGAPVAYGEEPACAELPRVLAPTVMGSVEISRGCGLGCRFCTIARRPIGHLPEETILADARTNVHGGAPALSLITEDLFRYGSPDGRPRPERVIGLLEKLRDVAGDRLIQTDHANISSVAQFDDGQLARVRELMGSPGDYIWLNLGVETASGRLLAANGGAPKMRPFSQQEWGDACAEQVRRLCRAGFFPLVSLVVALPGEAPEDVAATIRWAEGLADQRLSIFPVLYAPIGEAAASGAPRMTRAHWRLVRICYRMNFRWVPTLVWSNQRRAGVPLWRRSAAQALGRMQVLWWSALFRWRGWRAPR
jgi:radical SAM superfamily enzyme YgiQ (UPF0313 family)